MLMYITAGIHGTSMEVREQIVGFGSFLLPCGRLDLSSWVASALPHGATSPALDRNFNGERIEARDMDN